MHPSGVQFGLSRGLRQLRGEEILLSDQLVETISRQAQMYLQLGRPAMTTQAKKVVKIKPLEGYTAMSDADIVQRGTAAQTGLTGNSNFQNLPVDLAVLKTDIESLSALIAESLDGSKKVIAQKNKQREAVIKMLLLLGRFVEVHCNGDMAIFTSSGFVPASTKFDHGTPDPLRTSLTLHDVSTAYEKGWSKLRNGDLLNVAEREGYDVWSVPTTSPCRRYWQIACAVMGFVVVGVHTPDVS